MKKILILSVGIILLSCSNENVEIDKKPENKIFSIQDYYNLINPSTKHSLVLKNNSSLYTPNTISVINGTSQEKNSGLSIKINGTQYNPTDFNTNINNRTFWRMDNAEFKSVYGKNVKISFCNNRFVATQNSAIPKERIVYIPMLIDVNYTNLSPEKNVIVGTTVSWTIDKENTNGMVLAAEYDPLSQSDESIAQVFPNKIFNAKTVVDNGSYTITADDLSFYPDNASLVFYIGRANITVINDGKIGNDLSVVTFNENYTGFKIDKPK